MTIYDVGFEYGFEKGRLIKLTELVEKAMKKGFTALEIADLFEENIETIQKIIDELNSVKK